MKQSRRYLTLFLLIIILAAAAGLRFYNLNWDGGIFAHPDERSTVAFYAPTIRWPAEAATLLDPRRSSLNPFWDVANQSRRSYTYGHFPLYTLVGVANLFYKLSGWAIEFDLPSSWLQFLTTSLSPHGLARIGRGLMALADLASVYLLFLLGRRLYGPAGGLLAAALAAFTVLQIQLAHFFAVDPVSTTFTLLAIYGATLLYDRHSPAAAVVTGVGIGLAVASKFSALPIAVSPVLAGFLATLHWRGQGATSRSVVQNRMIGLVFLSLAVAFLVFALTSPFVLLDFANFRQAVIDEQGNMVSGVADFPFTRQYRNTIPYLYFIEQQLRWGMGWPLGLLALAGTLWVIGKTLAGKAQAGELLALAWVVLYFGPTGLFLAKFMRYMAPVVPFLTLFGAGLVVALWRWPAPAGQANPPAWADAEMAGHETSAAPPTPAGLARFSRWPQGLALAIAGLVLAGTIFWALAFVNGVYGSEHTWVTFARWSYANVPDGACIAYEHWDDRMPSDIPEPGGTAGAHGYFQPQLPMYDDDTQQKYELIRDTLSTCDYLVLASNRLWRTIPRLPERYPLSTRYYQALFSGALGFEPVYAVETPPRLGPFVIDDQPADESFTVYDHPKPMMFKKSRQLSEAEWANLLGNSWQQAIPGYVGPPTLLMRLRGQDAPPHAGLNEAEAKKSLLLTRPVDQLPPLNDFRWNSLANRSPLWATLLWWVVALLIGLISLPLTFLLCHNLPDRGYALSKSLGLLLISYFVWLNSSLGLLANSRPTVNLALAGLIGLNLWLGLRHRQALGHFWRQNRRPVLASEVVFAGVYLFFIYLRLLNPDLWQPWLGGEKMLEIGFLNAVVKSAYMPPYDPFYAGGIINYYYYGLFLIGVLIKLTGIQPGIAFNLAVPLLAALTASNVFSLAGNLAGGKLPGRSNQRALTAVSPLPAAVAGWSQRSLATGWLGVLLVMFIGNLAGAAQFMRNLGHFSPNTFHTAIPGLETFVAALTGLIFVTRHETPVPVYNYWDPTRVIPETINEFPYFSFLFADLHPHMIGIPFTVLFLSLAYNWLRPAALNLASQAGPAPAQTFLTWPSPATVWRWLALPFVLGAIAAINTWDLPTYLGIMVSIFLLSRYRQLSGPIRFGQAIQLALSGLVFAVLLSAATYLLYRPFFGNYQPPAETGLGLVHTQTPLDQHLKIWGFFLFILVSWLGVSILYPASRNSILRFISLVLRRWNVAPHLSQIYRRLVQQPSDLYQWSLWGLAGLALTTLALSLAGYAVPAYLLPLASFSALLLFRHEVSTEIAYLALLLFTGLLILLGLEFFFLRDFLGGGEYYRMNTLFKFFIQVWVMFGLAAAVAWPQLWQRSRRWPWSGQLLWQGLGLILLLASLIYPIFATRTRVSDRFPGEDNRPPLGSLDGLAYMTVGVFEWPAGSPIELKYDYEAIRWLQEHVSGTPVIAEAKIGYYREGGMRVAAYTGLPSILGGLHQNEQRYASQIAGRDLAVNEFWQTPDLERLKILLDQLDITYIYIGQIERITYGDQVEQKFVQLAQQGVLELVFENEKTKIYRRNS
jgi:YYY domain-containing protein